MTNRTNWTGGELRSREARSGPTRAHGDYDSSSDRAGLASLLLLLCACSDVSSNQGTRQTGERVARDVVVRALDDEQRTVAHTFGVSRVPLEPQRIVSLGLAEELLLLGEKPIAETLFFGEFREFLQPYLDDVLPIGTAYGSYQPDLEAIYAASPDLILATAYAGAGYAQLSSIAPTVVVVTEKRAAEWDFALESLHQVARVLGKEERAQEVEEAFRAKADTARELLREHRTESVATFRVLGRTYRMNGRPQGGGPILHDLLELEAPEIIRRDHWARTSRLLHLNEEKMLDLDVDHLFVLVNPTLGSSRTMAAMEERVVWQRLPAVRSGRVYPVDTGPWQGGRLLGHEQVVDDVVWHLAGERLPKILDGLPGGPRR